MRQIDPGRTFIYRWKATISGAFWWHSHQKSQIEDGLYGPLTIYPKPGTPKPWGLISNDPVTVAALEAADENVQPLLLGDLEHRPSPEIYDIVHQSGIEILCYDSILINGEGHVNCVPQEEMDKLINPSLIPLMEALNISHFTPKG